MKAIVLCLFGISWVGFAITNVRLQRLCRIKGLQLPQLENIKHHYFSEFRQGVNGSQDIQLKVNISWSVPEEQSSMIDGFLVRFVKTTAFPDASPLIPTNICYQGNEYLWLKTSNLSSCSNVSQSCKSSPMASTTVTCLCMRGNCSLLYGGKEPYCRGVESWMRKQGGGYISIPTTTRTLTFEIDFLESYISYIRPYYREVTQSLLFAQDSVILHKDCVDVVSKSSSMSIIEAEEACCSSNTPHATARNFTVADIIPDFHKDTVNMTVIFHPPIRQDGLEGFAPLVVFGGLSSRNVRAKSTEPGKVFLPIQPNNAKCDKKEYYYQATLYDLIPGLNYSALLSAKYEEKQQTKYKCREGKCRQFLEISVPEINSCNFKYCAPDANCYPEDTKGSDTLKSKCHCKPGYKGDGQNTWNNLATGCNFIDRCAKSRSPCSNNAFCEDPSPLHDVTCTCLSAYYGDGFQNGTGCTSRSSLGWKIGVPVAIVVLIVIIVVAWKFRLRDNYKKKFRFGKFQGRKQSPPTQEEGSTAM